MSYALVKHLKKDCLKVVHRRKIKESVSLKCILMGGKSMLKNVRRQLLSECRDCEVLLPKLKIPDDSSLPSSVQPNTRKSRYSLSPDSEPEFHKEPLVPDDYPLYHNADAPDAFYIDIDEVRGPQVGVCTVKQKSASNSDVSTIEDPYANLELSEEEYVPEQDDTSASSDFESGEEAIEVQDEKTNEQNEYMVELQNEEIVELQNEDSTELQNEKQKPIELQNEITVEERRLHSVSRRLFDDNDDETQRNTIQPKETTEKVQIATVELRGTTVNINLKNTLHKGAYSGIFFRAATIAGDDVLQSYIFQKDPPDRNHVCSVNGRDTRFVATLSRDEGSKIYEFESQFCLEARVFLSGNEVTFMKGTKNIACLEMVIKKSCTNISVSYDPYAKSKRHCCLYCGQLKSCISRHLILQHKNEKDIEYITSLTPNSKKRNELLRKIRLKGDKNFNENFDNFNKIPVRRPVTRTVTEYQHCPACKALISKKNLARHHMKCTGRRPDRQRIVRQENQINEDQHYHTRLLEKILGSLKDDEIGQIIRGDRALKLLAMYYALLHSKSSHQTTTCRAQLRRCGRLLLILKEMDPSVTDFADCLKVTKYETVMNAIRRLCNLRDDDDSTSTEKPLLALQFGPIISQITERLKVDLLKRGKEDVDPEYVELVKFKQIHDRDFRIEITRRALITAKINKFRNKPELPTGDDVIRFTKYLQDAAIKSYTSLATHGFSFHMWKMLAESVLCQILIFNRRRVGEASRMKLFDFTNRKQVMEDQYKHLTRLQIILAKYYSVMFMMAKGNRVVSVLLNPQQIKYLNLLISMRVNMNIPASNPFLFAFPNKEGHLNASVVLTELSKKSDVSTPKCIRATYLRKQVATMSQYLNLSDNEIQQLADFMGHTLEVHKQFYRTPESVNAITKLSRFFSVLGAHNLESYRGKSLEELEPELPEENYDADDLVNEYPQEIVETTEITQEADVLQGQDSSGPSGLGIPEVSAGECSAEPVEVSDLSEPAAAPELPESRQTPERMEVVKEQYSTPPKWKLRSRQIMKKLSPRKGLTMADLITRINKQATPPKRRIRSNTKRWSRSEKAFMTKMFADYLAKLKLPSMEHCKQVLERNSNQFQKGRTPIILYSWIRNQIVKSKLQ